MNRPSTLALLALACALASPPARAQGPAPFAPTADEMKALPPECSARLGNDPAAQAQYRLHEARYGRPIWDHYHHWCFAMNFMSRSRLTMDKKARRYALQLAMNNFDYLLRHWPAEAPQVEEARQLRRLAELQFNAIR